MFPWGHEGTGEKLDAAALTLGIDLHEGAPAMLSYARLLLDRALPRGMISQGDAGRILERHIIDSLRAAPALDELGTTAVVDLGSGAGLPGLPLAIARPGIQFTLAESRMKRVAFLELAVERLGLRNVDIHADRAESIGEGRFDAAVARAFAPAASAWQVAFPLLRVRGVLVLFTGTRDRLPFELAPVATVRAFRPRRHAPARPETSGGTKSWRSSRATPLATGGDLVIITAK